MHAEPQMVWDLLRFDLHPLVCTHHHSSGTTADTADTHPNGSAGSNKAFDEAQTALGGSGGAISEGQNTHKPAFGGSGRTTQADAVGVLTLSLACMLL